VRGLFVTGTDTGAGKTLVSAAIVAAMAANAVRMAVHKPVLTGTAEPPGEWPPDDELLALAAGVEPDGVTSRRYAPAVSPHLAASLAGEKLDPAELVSDARAAGAGADALIVEGVGGLLVPFAGDFTVRDLAVELCLDVLIAARPVLGTINHSLLTVEAARDAGLDVKAVVMTPWPERPSAMERSNRETVARLGEVEVATLAEIPGPDAAALARAGEQLPWRDWLGPS
jgi:dethiobiotin synthetase